MMTATGGAACLAGLDCVFAPQSHAAVPDEYAAALRGAIEPMLDEARVPAVGLGVIDQGEVIFLGGLGSVAGRPATEHDRFRAASISKLFTAQAVMLLAQARKLSPDEDVGRWLPAFAGRGLTLHHLLTHRSGLRDTIFPFETDDPARVADYLKQLAEQPAGDLPGARYAYTDADYNLLGAVVAAASGQPYVRFVQTEILDRLRLRDAEIFPAPSTRANLAPPFLDRPALRPATGRPFDIAFAPSEGLVTGARDLTLWTQATLRQDPRLLKRTSFQAMIQPRAEAGSVNRHMGYGWQLRRDAHRAIAEHGGSVRGYNALVLTYPRERRGFVILTNADDAPRWQIAKALDRALDAAAGQRRR